VKQKLKVEFYIPLAGCRVLSSSAGKETLNEKMHNLNCVKLAAYSRI